MIFRSLKRLLDPYNFSYQILCYFLTNRFISLQKFRIIKGYRVYASKVFFNKSRISFMNSQNRKIVNYTQFIIGAKMNNIIINFSLYLK